MGEDGASSSEAPYRVQLELMALIVNRVSKKLGKNPLAYLLGGSVTKKKKCFVPLTLGTNVIKLFTDVSFKFS